METEASEPHTAAGDSNSQTSESDSTSSSMDVGTSKEHQQQQQQQQQQQRPKQPMKLRKCSFEECKETVLRGKSGPWMCKYHRNKTYKETYKKKKGKNNPMLAQQKKVRYGDYLTGCITMTYWICITVQSTANSGSGGKIQILVLCLQQFCTNCLVNQICHHTFVRHCLLSSRTSGANSVLVFFFFFFPLLPTSLMYPYWITIHIDWRLDGSR